MDNPEQEKINEAADRLREMGITVVDNATIQIFATEQERDDFSKNHYMPKECV